MSELNDKFMKCCRTDDTNNAVFYFTSTQNKEEAFKICCLYASFSMAKLLYLLGANIFANNNAAFIASCKSDKITMPKWLHRLGADIHAQDEEAFLWCCQYKKMEIAKWLHSVGANIHARNETAFIVSWGMPKWHIGFTRLGLIYMPKMKMHLYGLVLTEILNWHNGYIC
jgi:hypothetical protein